MYVGAYVRSYCVKNNTAIAIYVNNKNYCTSGSLGTYKIQNSKAMYVYT